MRPMRLVIVAGAGVLVLCAIAVASSVADYVSHPAGVANTYVPPFAASPEPSATSTPVAPDPVSTSVTFSTPTPAPAPPAVRPAPVPSAPADSAVARLIQQFQLHRHRVPRVG